MNFPKIFVNCAPGNLTTENGISVPFTTRYNLSHKHYESYKLPADTNILVIYYKKRATNITLKHSYFLNNALTLSWAFFSSNSNSSLSRMFSSRLLSPLRRKLVQELELHKAEDNTLSRILSTYVTHKPNGRLPLLSTRCAFLNPAT